jgi:hypothetical protein
MEATLTPLSPWTRHRRLRCCLVSIGGAFSAAGSPRSCPKFLGEAWSVANPCYGCAYRSTPAREDRGEQVSRFLLASEPILSSPYHSGGSTNVVQIITISESHVGMLRCYRADIPSTRLPQSSFVPTTWTRVTHNDHVRYNEPHTCRCEHSLSCRIH